MYISNDNALCVLVAAQDNALCVLVAAQEMLRASFWKACACLADHEPESIDTVDQFIATVQGLLSLRNAGAEQISYNYSLCYSFTAQAGSVTLPCKYLNLVIPQNKGASYMAVQVWHDVAPNVQLGDHSSLHKCRTYKMSVAGWHRICACKCPYRCLRRQMTAALFSPPWSLQP